MGRRFDVRILIALAACASFPSVLAAQSPPAPWTAADIGAPAVQGFATLAGPRVSISGAGSGVSGTVDQFMFVYQSITGDAAIVARVDGLEGASERAEAGVMIRESLVPGSKEAFVQLSGGDAVAFHRRPLTGSLTTLTPGQAGAAPAWLKLERRASMLNAFRSSDGVTWTAVGADVISMSPTVFVGLAVTSSHADTSATATFSSVSVTPLTDAPAPLPAGWRSMDVGLPLRRGTATYRAGTFIVTGGGSDIWGTADQFHYAYRLITGDIDITGRVAAVEAVDAWTKAGVMLRDALTPNAAHVSLLVTPARGVAFERRPVAGGASLYTKVARGRAPRWVKLQRRGTRVSAYQSFDGLRWILTGTGTLVLPTIYVGLAVTSRDATTTATALFDHIIVGPPNDRPVVVLTDPEDHTMFVEPATVDVSAAASDADGFVARVDFFAGATWIGSDATPPYTVTWAGVLAGDYRLRAVVWDNKAAAGISTVRSILVALPGGGYQAVFVPSTNHDTAVIHYLLEIFERGADPGTAEPVSTISLGKPVVVNGECAVDVTAAITSLPPGTFVVTVTAVGTGGAARSDPSPPFVR